MSGDPLRSRIVVVSWWSNCLGLASLHGLVRRVRARPVNVIQIGKTPVQMQRFRHYLPRRVTELTYPPDDQVERAGIVQRLAQRELAAEGGLWFFDHDVFVHADLEAWLRQADAWLSCSDSCMCLPRGFDGSGSHIFWISPARWPNELPFPDLEDPYPGSLPGKETMRTEDPNYLQDLERRVAYFPISEKDAEGMSLGPFPAHTHMGGLNLFSQPAPQWKLDDRSRGVVDRFSSFFEACPPEWLTVEDPYLLDRLCEYQGVGVS